MSVITTIFNAIVSFFETALIFILLIILSGIIIIYTIYDTLRPRYEITDDILNSQGMADIQFIGSDFEATDDYERTYFGFTREEYEEYCEYLFDYVISKEHPVYKFDYEEQPLPFPRFYMYHFSLCDSIESLFSDDGSTFGIYYTYNDRIRGLKVSFAGGDVVIAIHKASDADIYTDPSESDIGELMPEG